MIHTCPSCGLFGRKVRRRERQARRTAEAGLVAWFAALRAVDMGASAGKKTSARR